MNSCAASLFSTFSLTADNLAPYMLRLCDIDLPHPRTARKLARLGNDFGSIDISNRHVTQCQGRRDSQVPDKTEESLYYCP